MITLIAITLIAIFGDEDAQVIATILIIVALIEVVMEIAAIGEYLSK